MLRYFQVHNLNEKAEESKYATENDKSAPLAFIIVDHVYERMIVAISLKKDTCNSNVVKLDMLGANFFPQIHYIAKAFMID